MGGRRGCHGAVTRLVKGVGVMGVLGAALSPSDCPAGTLIWAIDRQSRSLQQWAGHIRRVAIVTSMKITVTYDYNGM